MCLHTANIDSFSVNAIVTNLGSAVNDSFNIQVMRTFPDGTTNIAAMKRFATPVYIDTFQLFIQTKNDTTEITGDNFFEINIDLKIMRFQCLKVSGFHI